MKVNVSFTDSKINFEMQLMVRNTEILLHYFKSTYNKRWSKYFSIMTKIFFSLAIKSKSDYGTLSLHPCWSHFFFIIININMEGRKIEMLHFILTNKYLKKHIFMLHCIREKVVSRFVNWKVSRIFIDDLRNFDFWMNERH